MYPTFSSRLHQAAKKTGYIFIFIRVLDSTIFDIQAIKNTSPKAHTSKKLVFSAPSGARTLDTLIKSQVLYQLS